MKWNQGILLALTLSTVSTVALAQAGDQQGATPSYPANPPTQYQYQQPVYQQPAPIERSGSAPQGQPQYQQGQQQYQQAQPQYQQQYPQQGQQPYPQAQPQYQQQYPQQGQQPYPQAQPQYQQGQQPYQQQGQPQYQQQYPQGQQQYQQQYPQGQQQYQQQGQQNQQAKKPDYSNDFIQHLTVGQVIAPLHGTASAVPATGVFLRVAQDSNVRVVTLSDVQMELDVTKGVANVAVHNSVKGGELLVDLPGGQSDLVKDGFYTFNADTDTMRVLKGEAYVYPGDHMQRKPMKIKEKHAVYFNGPESHIFEFDPSEVTSDLVPFGPPQVSGQFNDESGYLPGGTGEPYDWYVAGYPYWWAYPYWWDPGWDWGWGLGWGWGWRGWGGWGYGGWGWGGRWGYGGWGRGWGGYGYRGGWNGGRTGGTTGTGAGGVHGGGGGMGGGGARGGGGR
ncbi:MAG: hypothetical protein ACP5E5_12165 [Acidobacteriaceae bacterium]